MGFVLGIVDTCIPRSSRNVERFQSNFVDKEVENKVSTTLLHKF